MNDLGLRYITAMNTALNKCSYKNCFMAEETNLIERTFRIGIEYKRFELDDRDTKNIDNVARATLIEDFLR